VEGHAVVVWQQGFDPVRLAGLASTRTYPLRSSFRPTYTMAVSLVGERGSERARALLESSFAQFQADRSVVSLVRQEKQAKAALEQLDEAIECERGDVLEYIALANELRQKESALAKEQRNSERAETVMSLEKLRIGDVIEVPSGRRAGLAIVLDPGLNSGQGPRPFVLTADRQAKRLSLIDFSRPVRAIARVKVPKTFNARAPQARRDLASQLRTVVPPSITHAHRGKKHNADELAALRRALHAHPVHSCPDRAAHLKQADRRDRASGDVKRLTQTIAQRTDSISRRFDRICSVLQQRGFLAGEKVTDDGKRLTSLHTESDLLLAEALRADLFAGLDAPSLAGVVSALVHEARGREGTPAPPAPASTVAALVALNELAQEVGAVELRAKLPESRKPDPGVAWAMHKWASGAGIGEILRYGELTAGDFVRTTRQVIDLLSQIAIAMAPTKLSTTARDAATLLSRGVVAYAMGMPDA
jgi:ATP-dependent RNA helicase HelY